MSQLVVLYEHAVGYSLFKVSEFEDIGAFLPQVEAAANDFTKFQKVVKLVAFKPFKSTLIALSNMNSISEGILTDDLSAFLKSNLPKSGKKEKTVVGVCDPKLGASISEVMDVQINHTGVVPEILRGIRTHILHFIKGLNAASIKQTELGLGHSYSRSKVKFNVNRVDNMIIQSIALVDQLDKDINTFSMRIREWYSYHFPELAKVVTDNHQYAECAYYIKNRKDLNENSLEKLEEITMDSAKAQEILDSSKMSMGMDISAVDLLNIEIFAKKISNLAKYRQGLVEYLNTKLTAVAPNLATVIGDTVAARLISHAGSLTNLAKYPASTVQILGAEKALFRAIRAKTNTPKYGLIYHSTFIGKAAASNKGRISRYLANKCSIASRIDCFSETLTNVFGMKLRGQIEERLAFYQSGDLPRKNVDVMTDAVADNKLVLKEMNKKKRKSEVNGTAITPAKKRSADENGNLDNGEMTNGSHKKKKKKHNVSQMSMDADSTMNTTADLDTTGDVDTTTGSIKKKKKKKKHNDSQMSMDADSTMDTTADVDTTVNMDTTGDLDTTTGEEKPKKKKKKNKSKA